MEGIIDKENERVRRFLALLDDMEKKVERLARDNRPPFNGERFLTDRELSGMLKISRRCLQDYRDQGRIPYIQLGGKILYRQSDIERLLEDFKTWLLACRAKIPNGSSSAKAIDYTLKRWAALTHYLTDGRVPIDNNWIENRKRPAKSSSQSLVIP